MPEKEKTITEGGKHTRFVESLSDKERPIILEAKNLEKTYDIGTPAETKALRGINLSITLGEIVVVFGPSGSGKSTLMNILAGLDEPTSGQLIIDGMDMAKITEKERVQYHQFKVGMVFQSYNLVPSFTVMQNVTMPSRLAGFKKKDYLERGADLLRQFDLEQLAERLPEQCSGGQQQRVGIMRALINRPSFIIADEPTGNLDSINAKHTMKLFLELNSETNTTMIIVTHDSSLFAIADRVVHVLDGTVQKQTILTNKAKVDLDKIEVPVEVKIRKKTEGTHADEEKGLSGGVSLKKEREQQSKISVLVEMLRERKALSAQTQHVLSVLVSLLTKEQQDSLDEEEAKRLVGAVKDRVEGGLSQSELQEILDRPFAKGGVGLYRQTAEYLASSIEAMMQLIETGVKKKKGGKS